MAKRVDKRAPAPSARMFETPFIEYFSRIHPASPFVFWLPVLGLITWWTLSAGTPGWQLGALALLGWVAWSLAEYLLHRYVFHWVRPKPWQRRFHFIFHGVHHDYPQDAKRLVMPLGVSIPIGLVFFLVVDALLPRTVACSLFVGFGLGYLLYDGIHYFTHHLPARSRIGKFLKRYHMVHHHTGVDGLYGVSTPLWDYAIGTSVDARQRRAARAEA